MISTVSPRARNEPRVKEMSLREYWMSTSARSRVSRSMVSPTATGSDRSMYDCGVPRP